MSLYVRPTSDQIASARNAAQRGGRIAYDALDFGVAAKNTYGQDGFGAVRNGSLAVQKYKKLKEDAGFKTGTWEEHAFGMAGDVANVSGMVVSAIALPKMAQKTATSFRELRAAILDPNASTDLRLNKLEDTARGSAGTIFSVQGTVLGAKATAGILSRNRGMAEVISKVSDGKVTRFIASPFGRVLNTLLPIADGAVFIGELIATRRVFTDGKSTSGQKAREVLNLGLSTLKVAFWVLPEVAILKELYTFASFGQLGLSLWDFQQSMAPHFKGALQTAGWAVTHPFEALGSLGKQVASGVGSVFNGAASVLGGFVNGIVHPVDTWHRAATEVSAWYNAYLVAKGRQLVSYVWPPGNFGAPVSQAPAVQMASANVPMVGQPAAAPMQMGAGVAFAPIPAVPAAPPPLPAAPPVAPAAPPPPPAPMPSMAAPAPYAMPAAPVAAPAAAPGTAFVAALPVGPTVQSAYAQALNQINQMGTQRS